MEAVEETLKGNTIHMLAKKSLPRLDLPKVLFFASPAWVVEALVLECRQNPSNCSSDEATLLLLWRHQALRMLRRSQVRKNRHIEIIPLSTGCLGACTYCKTKHARGVLGSYTLDAIVSRARQAVADPEVWHGCHALLGLTSRPAACSVARQAALPWHQWEHLDQLQLLPVQVREIWLSSEDTGAWGEASSDTAPQGAHGDSTAIHGA